MDNVTHSLIAITLSRTSLRRVGTGATAALLLASNAPDIDIVTAFSHREGAYLSAHRGPTHGPIGIVLLAAVTALLVHFWPGARGRAKRSGDEAPFAWLFVLGLIGATLHVLMDLPTSYGTRLLSPFVTTWFAFDWLPIIDPYLLTILTAGLITMRLRSNDWRRTTAIVLLAVGLLYVMRATMHDLAIAKAGGTQVATHLDAWPSSPRVEKLEPCPPSPGVAVPDASRRPCGIVALPTFLSPFEWEILERVPGGYRVSEIDVLGRPTRHEPVFYGTMRGKAIDEALQDPRARMFMSFARLPVAQVIRESRDAIVVGFQDLRFVRDLGEEHGQGRPRASPFFIFVSLDRRASRSD